MKHNYCPTCGEKLILKNTYDDGLVPFCQNCNKFIFDSASPCVILLITNEFDEVCIIRQSYGTERPVLVAGYVKCDQTVEDTIINETFEEIGQDVESWTYINSYYYEKNQNLMLGFYVKVKQKEFKLSKELKNASWENVENAAFLLSGATIASKLLEDIRKRNLI